MEEKLKIKLSIADRVYPLTIRPEQEEGLRKAAKSIDLLAKQYEQNYAVRDKQDVLAMCALQFASSSVSDQQEETGTSREAMERLEAIAIRISTSLRD